MKTPREKAEELVNKFYNYVFNPESHKDDNLKFTKECALIAVDEIIINGFNPQLPYNYWQEVKKEIENLNN